MKNILTKSNCDEGGRIINSMIDEYVSKNYNAVAFESLGMIRYLSALKYSSMVIGNSSSGIVEAPVFKIPTINIGDRQRGRLQSETIINCEPEIDDIYSAVKKARSNEFRVKAEKSKNLYGDGNTSDKIVDIIREFLMREKVDLKKKFYGIR